MALYLRIRNPGVAPVQGFTVFGASLSRNLSESPNSWIIGMFGSGSKHAIALCLRHIDQELNPAPCAPTIFCSQHRLDFFTEQEFMKEPETGMEKRIDRIYVKHSGIDQDTGRPRRRTEKTSNSLDSGTFDWKELSMAMREFVTNALDMAFRLYCVKYMQQHGGRLQDLVLELDPTAAWRDVSVTIVDEDKVKAEVGYTNVFVPLNQDIQRFYESIGRYFLHFSDIKSIKTQAILPKASRNLPHYSRDGSILTRQTAVIYRKGVRVREYNEDYDIRYGSNRDLPSLFDYNLNDMRIDEARKVDDYAISGQCAAALGYASQHILDRFFLALKESQPQWVEAVPEQNADGDDFYQAAVPGHWTEYNPKYWELKLESYELANGANESEGWEQRHKNWQQAFAGVFGPNGVLCDPLLAGIVQSKGYVPVHCGTTLKGRLAAYGIKTDKTVLTSEDLTCRLAVPPEEWMIKEYDSIWEQVVLTCNLPQKYRVKPELQGFVVAEDAPIAIQQQSTHVLAYINKRCIYVSLEKFGIAKLRPTTGNVSTPDMEEVTRIQNLFSATMLEQIMLCLTGKRLHDMSHLKFVLHLATALLDKSRGYQPYFPVSQYSELVEPSDMVSKDRV